MEALDKFKKFRSMCKTGFRAVYIGESRSHRDTLEFLIKGEKCLYFNSVVILFFLVAGKTKHFFTDRRVRKTFEFPVTFKEDGSVVLRVVTRKRYLLGKVYQISIVPYVFMTKSLPYPVDVEIVRRELCKQ